MEYTKKVNKFYYRCLEGSRKLRFPKYITMAHSGGKVVSLTHRPLFTSRKSSWYSFLLGTAVAQWLRCCATNWKVAGSIPDGVFGVFH
jgi:hypothetical protein